MQISLEKKQLKAVALAQELMLFLAEHLPDVETVDIHRREAFCPDTDLPAVEIKIAEQEVISAKQLPPDITDIDEASGSLMSRCCQYQYKVRQFYTINVITSNCEGAYAEAGVIESYIEQLFCQAGEFIYGGTVSADSNDEEAQSNDLFIRSLIYYVEYEKP